MPPELLQRMQELEQENGQLKQQETIKLAELELESTRSTGTTRPDQKSALISAGKELHKGISRSQGRSGEHAAADNSRAPGLRELEWKTGRESHPDSED